MIKKIVFFTSILGMLYGFFLWYRPTNFVSTKPLIVVTTGMIADLISNIVGDQALVVALMGAGVDPHMYRARASDISRFEAASLIVYNGLHLEGKMADLFEQMSHKKKIVSLGSLVPINDLIVCGAELYDPHIWHDVLLWSQLIDALIPVLSTIVNDQEKLAKSATIYKERLQGLHQYVVDQINDVPLEKRILITAHDAFHYFAKRYNVIVRGLQGVSTASQAGLFDVQALAEYIIGNDVSTIFVESCVSSGGMQVLQEMVQQSGKQVLIGSELYADALGDSLSGHDTYEKMIMSNVNAIVGSWGD